MRAKSLQIPSWVSKAFQDATNQGLIKLPRTGWNQSTISTFLHIDKRCWFISDSFSFRGYSMVCDPETCMSASDPLVIEQCNFLATLLNASYQIWQIDDLIRVEFRYRGGIR